MSNLTGYVAEIRLLDRGPILAFGFGSRPYVAAQRAAAMLAGGEKGPAYERQAFRVEVFIRKCDNMPKHRVALCSCPIDVSEW